VLWSILLWQIRAGTWQMKPRFGRVAWLTMLPQCHHMQCVVTDDPGTSLQVLLPAGNLYCYSPLDFSPHD